MRILTNQLFILLIFASCNIFGSEESTGVQIELSPKTISLNERANLKIENLTETRIRLICGYSIEILQNEAWQKHNGLGCSPTASARMIQPEEIYSRTISLFAKSPGTYRIVLNFAILENGEWIGETFKTNPVKVK